jgi:hypothetical protein
LVSLTKIVEIVFHWELFIIIELFLYYLIILTLIPP